MIGALALVVFVLSCSAVGLRLIWIGNRDGFGPAWSCGNGFLFIALVGQPLTVASGLATGTVGSLNHGMAAAAMLFMAAGLSSFYAFTLTVFRPRSPWAWASTAAAVLGLGVCTFGRIDALASADRALLAERGRPGLDARALLALDALLRVARGRGDARVEPVAAPARARSRGSGRVGSLPHVGLVRRLHSRSSPASCSRSRPLRRRARRASSASSRSPASVS